jgi:putative spermidine/putrescine transport system ATP-binding protein
METPVARSPEVPPGGQPARGEGPPALALRGLRRRFGDAVAVDGVDLEVARGEFVTLLGPSGSGKTTTLRMIAGFLIQDEGTIEIAGQEMSRVPSHQRDVGMVFQNYALFPHMTAAQNVAFPLQMRGVSRSEQRERVDEALEMVKLGSYGARYPRQLSGGQQQRIALARAVVFRPRLLLMDEPLGALDKKLREALQLEILHITRHLGATVVYVTHDQEEALVMSDRIAIFDAGRIQQLGRGEELYQRPASLFVAGFVGESNIFKGRLDTAGGQPALVHGESRLAVDPAGLEGRGLGQGTDAALVVRPEDMRVVGDEPAPPATNAIEAVIGDVLYLGPSRRIELTSADGVALVVREAAAGASDRQPGEHVRLVWPVERGVVVPLPVSTAT